MLKGIKLAKLTRKINYLKIPVTQVKLERFNEIVRYYNDLYEKGKINRIFAHTNSGGISIARQNFTNFNCYEVIEYKWGCELVIIDINGMCRIQIEVGQHTQVKDKMRGKKAYTKFKKELKKDKIDISNYFIDNGKDIKETIPKPLCEVVNKVFIGKTFENAYHLDLNSAYPSAMVEMYPEWKTTIERIYDNRKEKPIYKSVLNMTYGYFQSKLCKYRLANVSKYCIERTNNKLIEKANELKENGCIILSYNTDGIWFIMNDDVNKIFKIKLLCYENNKKLGDFKLDHKKCKIRFKGCKSYEYIENNKFNVVQSGSTILDRIKPRDKWEWGDIFKTHELTWYMSDTEYGVIEEVEADEI